MQTARTVAVVHFKLIFFPPKNRDICTFEDGEEKVLEGNN